MINPLDGNRDRAWFTQPEDMVMARSVEETTFCQLSKKMLKNEMETYVKLVSKPKFMCAKCFRVSSSKQNLCQPKKIKVK